MLRMFACDFVSMSPTSTKTHLRASRFRLQDLIKDIEIFRGIHTIDTEIECPCRQAVLAGHLVENFWRNCVVEAARPEKKRIELILVLREEF